MDTNQENVQNEGAAAPVSADSLSPPRKPSSNATNAEKDRFDDELIEFYKRYLLLSEEDQAIVANRVRSSGGQMHTSLFRPRNGINNAKHLASTALDLNILPGNSTSPPAPVGSTPAGPFSNLGAGRVTPAPASMQRVAKVFGITSVIEDNQVATGSELERIMQHVEKLAIEYDPSVVKPYEEQMKMLHEYSQYAGLDVPRMRQQIVKNARTVNESHPEEPLIVAMVIGLVRGNNVTRMKSTSKATLKPYLELLSDKLKVVDKVNKRPEAITLTRILICFPELAATVASFIKPTGVVFDIPEGYPHCMRNPSFSGLIPRSAANSALKKEHDMLMKAQILYQAKTSMQLSTTKSLIKLDKGLLERQKQFVISSIQLNTLSDEKRTAALNREDYNIYVNGVLNQAIIDHANEYDYVMRM